MPILSAQDLRNPSCPPDGQRYACISGIMRLFALGAVTLVLGSPTSAQSAPTPASTPPLGLFLWYPGPEAPEDDGACQELVDRLQPSRKKLEDWLWGRVPYDSSALPKVTMTMAL